MSPILKAFLKADWIQVGEGVPVFFRYDPTNVKYPFHIIFTEDEWAYFYLYDEWVNDGKIQESMLDGTIEGLVRSAFDHTYATSETFHTGLMDIICAHYKYNSFGKEERHIENRQKGNEYNDLYLYLINKKRNERNTVQQEKL